MEVELNEKEFKELFEKYLKKVYEYNSKLPNGIILKPFHYVYRNGKKYVYIGRYFYKVVKENGKVKWKYIGKEVPNLPKPPANPFEGLRFRKVGDKYYVEKEELERILKMIS